MWRKWGIFGVFLSTFQVQNIDYQHFNKNNTNNSPPGELLKMDPENPKIPKS